MSRVVVTGGLYGQSRGVSRVMTEVMLALLPGTLLYAWLIHPRVLLNIALAILFSASLEALALRLRQRPVWSALQDGSIVLSACLLALAVTPLLPWWQLAIGCAAMTLLGKHLYGGLGNNPFNPAMVGYAVLIVSFPLSMTQWPTTAPSLTPATSEQPPEISLKVMPGALSGTLPGVSAETSSSNPAGSSRRATLSEESDWDALTGATPLDRIRERGGDSPAVIADGHPPSPDAQLFATPWPWISLAWLAGGLILLWRRLITWHIPVSMLTSLALLQALNTGLSHTPQLSIAACLLSGGIMLGAFFIATDPVSAASSRYGQLVFGTGIGCLAFFIREFSAYPEGVAFAVLLMNLCVPLIDHFTTPVKWS